MGRYNGGALTPGNTRLITIVSLCAGLFCLSSCAAEEPAPPKPATAPATAAATATSSTEKPDVAGPRLTPKAITASNNKSGKNPAATGDGDLTTGWSAGDYAPQWIQLDLGAETAVSRVLLNVDQDPAGPTTHELYGGASPDNLKLLGAISGDTKLHQWIDFKIPAATDVRYLKIATAKSPSWIGWLEIEVYK
jgi:hypothetical protein